MVRKYVLHFRDFQEKKNILVESNFQFLKTVSRDILLSKPESVEFLLIESVICLFTDSSVQKYFPLIISRF